MNDKFKLRDLNNLTDDYSYENKNIKGFKITVDKGERYIEFIDKKEDIEKANKLEKSINNEFNEIINNLNILKNKNIDDIEPYKIENCINILNDILYNINKRYFLLNEYNNEIV